jgi:ubiquinone biosynthesis protein UbiJ
MINDPGINVAALAALEAAINNALQLDPALRSDLGQLDDTVLKIECTIPEIVVYLLPQHGHVHLYSHYEIQEDSSISGPASEYVKLLSADDKASALINGELKINGDSNAFMVLQKAIAKMDIDIEQKVADLIGDVPAHQLGKAVRKSIKWARHSRDSLLRNLEEFIHEEARLSPSQLEVEDFYRDIQQVNLAADRLEARIKRLGRQLDSKETQG